MRAPTMSYTGRSYLTGASAVQPSPTGVDFFDFEHVGGTVVSEEDPFGGRCGTECDQVRLAGWLSASASASDWLSATKCAWPSTIKCACPSAIECAWPSAID